MQLVLTSLPRFSVPHDRLFLDALERDLKREKMSTEPTTHIAGEPARSFAYDMYLPTQPGCVISPRQLEVFRSPQNLVKTSFT